jgi:hypothetical protein
MHSQLKQITDVQSVQFISVTNQFLSPSKYFPPCLHTSPLLKAVLQVQRFRFHFIDRLQMRFFHFTFHFGGRVKVTGRLNLVTKRSVPRTGAQDDHLWHFLIVTFLSTNITNKKKLTPWPKCVSELYRLNDCR